MIVSADVTLIPLVLNSGSSVRQCAITFFLFVTKASLFVCPRRHLMWDPKDRQLAARAFNSLVDLAKLDSKYLLFGESLPLDFQPSEWRLATASPHPTPSFPWFLAICPLLLSSPFQVLCFIRYLWGDLRLKFGREGYFSLNSHILIHNLFRKILQWWFRFLNIWFWYFSSFFHFFVFIILLGRHDEITEIWLRGAFRFSSFLA